MDSFKLGETAPAGRGGWVLRGESIIRLRFYCSAKGLAAAQAPDRKGTQSNFPVSYKFQCCNRPKDIY